MSPEALPTLDELDAARADRGIAKMHMATLVDFTTNGSWRQAVNQQTIAEEKRHRAVAVFDYYDYRGISPEYAETST